MSIVDEFATVELILGSGAETRGVDAFALSLIKAERQVRKLFTHLVYQFPIFGPGDVAALRYALGANRHVYLNGFIAGFDALYPRSIQALVGPDYCRLKRRLDELTDYRNKIFHGQLTPRNLARQDLLDLVTDTRAWCTNLGTAAEAEVGYDGFAPHSFHKLTMPHLWNRFKIQLASAADYEGFISAYMESRRNP